MMSDDAAFRLLLLRLDAPARLVRLLAARAIGALLSGDREGVLRQFYLDWFRGRPLEILACEAAIPVGLSGPRSWTDLSDFARAERPSLLLDVLVGEMFGRRPAFPSWRRAHARRPPANFRIPEDFVRLSESHTAPIFPGTLRRVDADLREPFLLRQYAWEHAELSRMTGWPGSRLDYFADGFTDSLGGYESPASALHLSAYLRAIHFAVSEENISLGLADYLVGSARPAHIGLAAVRAGSPPSGWPRFETDEEVDEWFDALQTEGAAPIADDHAEWAIVAASALVYQSEERWYELNARSAWARVRPAEGSEAPHESAISTDRDGDVLLPFSLRCPILPEQEGFLRREEPARLTASAHPRSPAGRWHLDVILRCGVVPVLPFRHGPLSVDYDQDSIAFGLEGRTVARWIHWHRNWSMSHPQGSGPTSGAALLVSRGLIDRIRTDNAITMFRTAHVESFPRGRESEKQSRREVCLPWAAVPSTA